MWHNLPSGGGLRVLDDQLRCLASRGHELHVWAPPGAAVPEATSVVASVHEVALRTPVERGVQQVASVWRGRRADLDALAEHSAQCAREMASIRPDLVLAHPGVSCRPSAIAQYVDVPCVAYLQEPNRRLFEAPMGFPWPAPPPSRRLTPGAARAFLADLVRVGRSRIEVRTETEWIHAFDEVLVNSAYSRESVLRAYDRTSRVCLLGIDTDRFVAQARPAEGRGTVLSVGAMVEEKRPAFLVRAMAAAGPAVGRFTWIANVVDERVLRGVTELATACGVPFELRHAVSDDELLRCYAEADVFAYAPRLEPFGLAPLEANATGLVAVAVSEGGVRETVVDGVNGVLVDDDAEAFGAAVTAILDDPARARTLGRRARDHVVATWSLDPAIDRLEALLRAAAGTPSS